MRLLFALFLEESVEIVVADDRLPDEVEEKTESRGMALLPLLLAERLDRTVVALSWLLDCLVREGWSENMVLCAMLLAE